MSAIFEPSALFPYERTRAISCPCERASVYLFPILLLSFRNFVSLRLLITAQLYLVISASHYIILLSCEALKATSRQKPSFRKPD